MHSPQFSQFLIYDASDVEEIGLREVVGDRPPIQVGHPHLEHAHHGHDQPRQSHQHRGHNVDRRLETLQVADSLFMLPELDTMSINLLFYPLISQIHAVCPLIDTGQEGFG